MQNGYIFSIADKNDIPEIETLVNSAYRGESSRAGWTTEADFLDGIRVDTPSLMGMIEDPSSKIMLCRTSEYHLVGCVYLQKQKNRRLYLGMLTVLPELQNSGVGKLLLEQSENYGREQGCTTVLMTVITIRRELIAWYERRGYCKTNEVRPFPNNPKFGIPKFPLEFVLMQKAL
jgi:ribosomal protein S18 acetylase RimI-like enzyme